MFKKFLPVVIGIVLAAVVAGAYSLSTKSVTTPYPGLQVVTQTANAISSSPVDIFSAYTVAGYGSLNVTIWNKNSSAALTSLHVYVSDNTTFTSPTTADLLTDASTVSQFKTSGIWTNCSRTLSAASKCVVVVPSNNFVYLKVMASSGTAVTTETKITGRLITR
jgi:hypothetical protein